MEKSPHPATSLTNTWPRSPCGCRTSPSPPPPRWQKLGGPTLLAALLVLRPHPSLRLHPLANQMLALRRPHQQSSKVNQVADGVNSVLPRHLFLYPTLHFLNNSHIKGPVLVPYPKHSMDLQKNPAFLALWVQLPTKMLGFSLMLKLMLCGYKGDRNKTAKRQSQRAELTPRWGCCH